jgi:hypothetical protein
MATLLKSPSAQWVLAAQFEFDISTSDAMVNTSSASTAFSAAAGTTYDVATLPYGAQVVGGDIVVKTVSNDTGTSTMSVGDSASATRYLGATNLKAAARTALVPTGYKSLGEAIRLTIANQNGNATTGNVKVTVLFTIDGRANENLKTV